MGTMQVGKVCRSVGVETARGGAGNSGRGAGEAVLMYEVVCGTPSGGRMPGTKERQLQARKAVQLMQGDGQSMVESGAG